MNFVVLISMKRMTYIVLAFFLLLVLSIAGVLVYGYLHH